MKFERVSALDGIRGFAVLLVLLEHSTQFGFFPVGTIWWEGAGRYGVFLFFVLSAFLLTRQFLDRGLERATLRTSLSEYFFRRFARILPLYTFVLIAYYSPVLWGQQGLWVDSWRSLAKSVVMYKAYGIFWTMPKEFAYYFLLPAVAFFMTALVRRRWMVYTTLALLILANAAFTTPSYGGGFLPFAHVFMMGSLLALASKDTEQWLCGSSRTHHAVRWASDAAAIGVLGILGYHIVGLRSFITGVPTVDPYRYELHFLTFGALSALLILFTLCGRGHVRKVFEVRPLRFLGKISYSAYLWHWMVLVVWEQVTPFSNGNLNFYIFLGLVLLVAHASWYVFEHRLYRSQLLRAPWDWVSQLWLGRAEDNGSTRGFQPRAFAFLRRAASQPDLAPGDSRGIS